MTNSSVKILKNRSSKYNELQGIFDDSNAILNCIGSLAWYSKYSHMCSAQGKKLMNTILTFINPLKKSTPKTAKYLFQKKTRDDWKFEMTGN